MDRRSIFTKTAKGLQEASGKTSLLARDLRNILKEIDGKAAVEEVARRTGASEEKLIAALGKLVKEGFARELVTAVRSAAAPQNSQAAENDLDFSDIGKTPPPGRGDESAKEKAGVDDIARAAAAARARDEMFALKKVVSDAATRARADAEAKSQAAAAARARAEAAVKAKIEAETRARAEAESRAKKEAEERARLEAEQKARLAAEASARADAEAKARAEARARAEAEARARAEAEAKAKKEAEDLRARLEAERAAREEAERIAKREAEERARREAEEKTRLAAEDRSRREAEAKARLEAEQARKEAEELRLRLETERAAREEAEARAKAEAEARARQEAEERARREAEEKARREAEERARREAEERARREAEEKARADAERARKEAEELRLRLEAERKAREEAEERAKAEAEARARQEAEERARREAEEKARREAERKTREEAEERARREAEEEVRREAERKAREEAEERARREAEEKARLEAEERSRREADEKARLEAERARKEAEELRLQLETERKAREDAEERANAEAEARAQEAAEDQARRQAEERARLDAERRAQQEAEERERLEVEAAIRREKEERERLEAEERARREEEERKRREEEEHIRRDEEERQAREDAERQAREQEVRAEKEAQEQAEKEARQRAKAEADAASAARKEERARKRAEEEERKRTLVAATAPAPGAAYVPAHVIHARRQRHFARPIAFGLFLALLAALIAIHLIDLDPMPFQRAAESRFGQPVKIGSVSLSLVPLPRVRMEKVTIGESPQVRIAAIGAVPEFGSLFGERKVFRSLELEGAVLPQEFIGAVLWGRARGDLMSVDRIVAKGLKLDIAGVTLPPLDVDATIGPEGLKALKFANSERKLEGTLQFEGAKAQLELTAKPLALPFAPQIELDNFIGKGAIAEGELSLEEFQGTVFDGSLRGSARLRLRDGWSFEGQLAAQHMDAAKAAAPLLGSGRLDGKGSFAMKAAGPDKLFASARIEGSIRVQKGSVMKVDLTRVLQGSASTGGTTPFSELGASLAAESGRLQVRQLRMAAGVLSGSGTLDVDAQKNLSGRLQLELRAQVTQARAALAVSGTLADPHYRRAN